ncbi:MULTISPECIES: hypothetical protein [unclassified Bradyrhizobium]|uniref:hypothetical protein n=1 Tax=unclassified Bradyrhizobium TaxID=2631580 RepID=UPI002916EC72|nr:MULTISPECIES: hypothetical protein [unclassified Bradyrhizobium]
MVDPALERCPPLSTVVVIALAAPVLFRIGAHAMSCRATGRAGGEAGAWLGR